MDFAKEQEHVLQWILGGFFWLKNFFLGISYSVWLSLLGRGGRGAGRWWRREQDGEECAQGLRFRGKVLNDPQFCKAGSQGYCWGDLATWEQRTSCVSHTTHHSQSQAVPAEMHPALTTTLRGWRRDSHFADVETEIWTDNFGLEQM